MPAVQTLIAAVSKLAPARSPTAFRRRPPGAALPEPLARATRSPYVRAGVEPPLREVLRDPIVRALMRGDGVSPMEVRRVLKAGRRVQGRAAAAQTACTGPFPSPDEGA